MPLFEFDKQLKAQNSLEIQSAGNTCLQGINERNGFCYFLLIKTKLGISSIFCYGPVIEEEKTLTDQYSTQFFRQEYNEKQLSLFISKWLNDKNKGITFAQEIEENKFLDSYVDITYTIINYGEEVY